MENKFKNGCKCHTYLEFQKYSNILSKLKTEIPEVRESSDLNFQLIPKANKNPFKKIGELILQNSIVI